MADIDGALKELARQRIATGELPCSPTAPTWGSRGSGAPCSLCKRPIGTEEIEYEVAAVDPRGIAEATPVRFHLTCHAAWQAECQGRPQHRAGA